MEGPPPRPNRRARLFELVGLSALVVAQPVFSTFQGNATDLVFRRTGAADIVAFGLLFTLVPPLMLWLFGWGVEELTDARVGRWVHAGTVGGLAGLFAIATLKDATELPMAVVYGVGAAALVAAVALRLRSEQFASVLRVSAVAAPLFLAIFWFMSPVTDVAFADGTAEAPVLDMTNPTDVVMIVFDELPTLSLLGPDDQIDAGLWPGFASLAEQSTWYRNATSISPTTPTAVPAIFTGQWPTDTEVLPTVANHPQNIFTLLGASHDLTVHESVSRLCPAALCGEAERNSSFSALVNDGVDVWWGFLSPERTVEGQPADFRIPQSDPSADNKINRWLDNIATQPDGHQLQVIHSVLPHQPWWRYADGRRYGGDPMAATVVPEGLTGDLEWPDTMAPVFAQQRHLVQLQWTDRLLAQMMAELAQRGQWDDALVIVTADHGVSFKPGDPIRGLGEDNTDGVMFVPLFVKLPGQAEGTIDQRPAQTIDVVPTVVDHLGAESPWPLDGRSLLGPVTPGDDLRRFTQWRLNSVAPDDGIFSTVDGATAYAQMLAREPVVPAGPAGLRLWQWGPYGGLVGQPLNQMQIGPESDLRIELDDAENLANVELTGPLPGYIAGTISGAPGHNLLVALNGQVVGWAESAQTGQGHRFWALAYPLAFQQGFNDLAIYEIVGDAGALDALEFRPVAIQG
ncbi:MAG: sulfatase-like hydrolase/transferase [Acidimicrobiales bacterium]|nr:sulfatase-like hydrolase/transferase [Acidimicrobiales bacterium]